MPAPVIVDAPPRFVAWGLVPDAHALLRSYFALHEWIGGLWYAWRGHG